MHTRRFSLLYSRPVKFLRKHVLLVLYLFPGNRRTIFLGASSTLAIKFRAPLGFPTPFTIMAGAAHEEGSTLRGTHEHTHAYRTELDECIRHVLEHHNGRKYR